MENRLFFNNSNGVKLSGVLSNPSGDKEKTIVIICHGFSNSKDGSFYVKLSNELNRKGFSTFRFDFFGHGESGGKFEDITVSEGVEDILGAIKYVKGLGYKKIALFGSSFGGTTGLLAASNTEDISLLILRAPVSDYYEVEKMLHGDDGIKRWKEEGFRTRKEGSRLNYTFYGDLKNHDAHDAAIKINAPVLLMHGDKDEVIPIEQSIRLYGYFKDCRLEIMKNARHVIKDDQEQVKKAIDLTVNFIMEKNG